MELPITKQCKIPQLSRSSLYYVPAAVNDSDRELMRLFDEIHLEEPYLGSRGMKSALRMRGHKAGRIHVRTLMRKMGIEALTRNLLPPNLIPAIRSIPTCFAVSTLLRRTLYGVPISPTSPWQKGSATLSPFMDWVSRKVLSWRLSNTLDTSFCVEALEEAVQQYGTPGIFNTDQGSQFTSLEFTTFLQTMASRSAWTARAAGETMYLSSVSGKPSNIRRYT